MELKCVSSGSNGNCYLLQADNGETLIIDCGVAIKDIKKGLNWDLKKVVGVLVTHHHKDHSRAITDLEKMGFQTFKPYEENCRIKIMGNFTVRTFELVNKDKKFTHTNADGTECPCYGFIIKHKDLGKMLYVTDTEYVIWKFKGINHILVSCNYQKQKINMNNSSKNYHVVCGHMELATVKEFVKSNYSNDLNNVILCHMSKDNAVPTECVTGISKIAPMAKIDYADKGKKWDLNINCPF